MHQPLKALPPPLVVRLINRGVRLGAFPWPEEGFFTKADRKLVPDLERHDAQAVVDAFVPDGTVTGRMTSSEPNFEELPRVLPADIGVPA